MVPLLYPWREREQSRWRVGQLRLMLIVVCVWLCFVLCSRMMYFLLEGGNMHFLCGANKKVTKTRR